METRDERVETILFLLQTSPADDASAKIRYADVRAAQLMLELRVHAVM